MLTEPLLAYCVSGLTEPSGHALQTVAVRRRAVVSLDDTHLDPGRRRAHAPICRPSTDLIGVPAGPRGGAPVRDERRVSIQRLNFVWFSVAGAGVVVLVASIVGARHSFIPAWEMRVFRAVNGLPGWLFFVLWLPMQLGNLVVGTAVGLAIAWWAR